jgi:hypothetical protein
LIAGKVTSKSGAENISPGKKRQMIEKWASIGINLPDEGWQSAPALYQYYKVLLNSEPIIWQSLW